MQLLFDYLVVGLLRILCKKGYPPPDPLKWPTVGGGDAGEDLLDLFVQVGVLKGGALGLQYGRGHPNNLSVLIELDIGGVADDAGLDTLAKPVLVDEDAARRHSCQFVYLKNHTF